MLGDEKTLSAEVTVCGASSLLLQVTVPPAGTVSSAGVKLKFAISTCGPPAVPDAATGRGGAGVAGAAGGDGGGGGARGRGLGARRRDSPVSTGWRRPGSSWARSRSSPAHGRGAATDSTAASLPDS